VGVTSRKPVSGLHKARVYTPDDIMAASFPAGRVIVYDDERGYLGGVIAHHLQTVGCQVRLVTPAAEASPWLHYTLEQPRVQRALLEAGVGIHAHRQLRVVGRKTAELACVFTDRREEMPCDALVLITERRPNADLYRSLAADPQALADAGIRTLDCIGDAEAPNTVAAAVYAGHLAARTFQADPAATDKALFRREMPLHAPL
jgi:dimethylamine/trimethylamine dehydrogenase